MNQELIYRLKTAAGYQKKAIQALFPEQVRGHLEVIESEWRQMVLELLTELWKDDGKQEEHAACKGTQEKNNSSKTHKVEIG